jgi:hypothetical protein
MLDIDHNGNVLDDGVERGRDVGAHGKWTVAVGWLEVDEGRRLAASDADVEEVRVARTPFPEAGLSGGGQVAQRTDGRMDEVSAAMLDLECSSDVFDA